MLLTNIIKKLFEFFFIEIPLPQTVKGNIYTQDSVHTHMEARRAVFVIISPFKLPTIIRNRVITINYTERNIHGQISCSKSVIGLLTDHFAN